MKTLFNNSKTQILTTAEMWDELLAIGVSEQTLQIITDINGYNKDTMCDILYAYTGEREFT